MKLMFTLKDGEVSSYESKSFTEENLQEVLQMIVGDDSLICIAVKETDKEVLRTWVKAASIDRVVAIRDAPPKIELAKGEKVESAEE